MTEVGAEWGSRTAGGVGGRGSQTVGGMEGGGGLVDTEVHPTLRRKNEKRREKKTVEENKRAAIPPDVSSQDCVSPEGQ